MVPTLGSAGRKTECRASKPTCRGTKSPGRVCGVCVAPPRPGPDHRPTNEGHCGGARTVLRSILSVIGQTGAVLATLWYGSGGWCTRDHGECAVAFGVDAAQLQPSCLDPQRARTHPRTRGRAYETQGHPQRAWQRGGLVAPSGAGAAAGDAGDRVYSQCIATLF